MTKFLDVSAVSALITSIGFERCLQELAIYITEDFRRWNDFEKSPRAACHSAFGVIEVMPVSDAALYSFKYVNGHPSNAVIGLPTVMAFGLLADVSTGMPFLLSEMTLMTAMRTAATSALVAREMARKNSTQMAVIGCGAQSEFQILAFHALLGISNFTLFDIDERAVTKVQRNLASFPDIVLRVHRSVADAVLGADIVTTLTATKGRATVLTKAMIQPGMHINGVGGDCPGKTELDPEILASARVVVEFAPQTRIEGEIQQMPSGFRAYELWEVLTGAAEGRQNPEQVTIFDSVGFALEDFSSLRYLHDKLREADLGARIELVPDLKDPKDLFALFST